jgi:hypothetical protein
LLLAALAAIAVAAPGVARADDAWDDDEGPLDDRAFEYTKPVGRNYARGFLEVLGVLGVGFGQYQLDKSNSVDWDLGYDWQSFRSKLLFEAVSLDTNRFATNWVTHPFAGYWYYSAMRQNRIGIPQSTAVAFGAAVVWEYLGEFKEQVSINDLIATPLGGVALGESTLQLGVLFQRSRPTLATRSFGTLLAPLKTLHDAFDGAAVAPPDAYDDLGFPADVWHRIRVGAGGGVTSQRDGVEQADVRLYASTRIVTLPHYGRAGDVTQWFDSGEVSDFDLGATVAKGGLADMTLSTRFMPAGYFSQDVRGTRGALHGNAVVAGFLGAFEYGVHDYDRDRRTSADQIALVGLGTRVEHTAYLGPLTFRASLDGLVDFGGVGAYALPEYIARAGDAGLGSVVAQQRYYHGYGATLQPKLSLEGARFDAGAEARFDLFTSMGGLDRKPQDARDVAEVDISDRRVGARAWLGYKPSAHTRVVLSGQRLFRAGVIGPVSSSRWELSGLGAVELDF